MSLDLEAIRARADEYVFALSRGYSAKTLAGQLLDDVPALVAEVERLRFSQAKLSETVAAFPDANEAANLAHARSERDALRAEVERLRAAEARVRVLVKPWTTNEYMCGDKPAAGRDVLRALDGAP